MEFKAIDPTMQVNGQTILSIIDGMGVFSSLATTFFTESGLPAKIDATGWYPQQSWLNAFKLIAKKVGSKTLNQIGTKIPENAKFPPNVVDIHSALASIDVAYHMNHRNNKNEILFNSVSGKMLEWIGHYHYQKTGDKSATITCDNPYPCDFDMGIITAMVKRFGIVVEFTHDTSQSCRKQGSERCIYTIRWV